MTAKTVYGPISCPKFGCPWESREYSEWTEEAAAKVDAAIHYVETHREQIPDNAPFGNDQCPKCLDILGLNGTVSCSECGYIPPDARLKP